MPVTFEASSKQKTIESVKGEFNSSLNNTLQQTSQYRKNAGVRFFNHHPRNMIIFQNVQVLIMG